MLGENLLFDVLQAVLLFFLNPLLAAALIASVFLGYVRVKRERRSFKVRLLPGLTECKRLLAESWLHALVLSVLISGIGIVVDAGWLVLFSVISVVTLLTFFYQVTSPIYAVAAAFFAIYFMGRYAEAFTYHGWTASSLDLFGSLAVTIPVIGGLLLVAEGLLIGKYAARSTSPFLVHTNRGLRAAVFKAKRLWLLPILFVVPGEMISSYVPYWPQFTLGTQAFSFVPIPLVIGFSQIARATYPDALMPKIGRAVVVTGVGVLIVGLAAMWLPVLGWTALLFGVISRATITIIVAIRERSGPLVAAPRTTGVVIAGVLPNSPGEKMGLLPGECIRSVNGQDVSNEKELYDAIQINAAHCRLQVLGRDGEARLLQQVIYRHDHHRLGLLVVR